jgi:hypothetical protein
VDLLQPYIDHDLSKWFFDSSNAQLCQTTIRPSKGAHQSLPLKKKKNRNHYQVSSKYRGSSENIVLEQIHILVPSCVLTTINHPLALRVLRDNSFSFNGIKIIIPPIQRRTEGGTGGAPPPPPPPPPPNSAKKKKKAVKKKIYIGSPHKKEQRLVPL